MLPNFVFHHRRAILPHTLNTMPFPLFFNKPPELGLNKNVLKQTGKCVLTHMPPVKTHLPPAPPNCQLDG